MGSPNSGKTTLFNALTGHRAKTGNYPGVTIDRREGLARTLAGPVRLIDLPGTYSLHAISEDEKVAVQVLRGEIPGEPAPDGIVVVADATTLERSLPMIAEVLQLGRPTMIALTMIDELKARKGGLDIPRLQGELGVPIVGVVGNRGIGIDDLRARLAEPAKWRPARSLPGTGTEARFAWADEILGRVRRQRLEENGLTHALDKVLLHPVAGPLVFLAFMAFFFQALFSWAVPAMDLLAGALSQAADSVQATLPDTFLTGLLANGLIRGVGAVVAFVPQILLLFAVIFFFEACGYMARAAFIIDRLMGWIGLEGRCFLALLSSYACAVPGILATRTIPSPRDRLATILVAPFMTCSARLPVYALLITAFLPATPVWGIFTLQGVTLMGLYLLGSVSALVFAGIFKRGLLRGATIPFYIELPPYRFPSLKVVGVQTWRRLKLFLRRAGTIILAASVVLWFLLNFPQTTPAAGMSRAEAHQATVENSLAADLGHAIEPVIRPLGWDWRVGVGLLACTFSAREVMVSTLAQVYVPEETGTGGDAPRGLAALLRAPNPETGKAPLSLAGALSLLVYFVFALQCVSTVVVMHRETNGWKWPAFAIFYMTALAWVAAWITFQVAA